MKTTLWISTVALSLLLTAVLILYVRAEQRANDMQALADEWYIRFYEMEDHCKWQERVLLRIEEILGDPDSRAFQQLLDFGPPDEFSGVPHRIFVLFDLPRLYNTWEKCDLPTMLNEQPEPTPPNPDAKLIY